MMDDTFDSGIKLRAIEIGGSETGREIALSVCLIKIWIFFYFKLDICRNIHEVMDNKPSIFLYHLGQR